jgi:hypothetical protein
VWSGDARKATFYTVFCSIKTKTKITINTTKLCIINITQVSRGDWRRRRGRRGGILKTKHEIDIYNIYNIIIK